MKSMDPRLRGISVEETAVYRCGSFLQAGTSGLRLDKTHTHFDICDPYYGASYIVMGEGEYVGHSGIRVPYRPGCLLQRFPGERHDTVYHPGKYLDKFIVLPPQFADILVSQHVASPARPIVEPGLSPHVCRRFDEFVKKLREQPEKKLHLLMAEMFSFVCELLTPASPEPSMHAAKMEKAAALMRRSGDASPPMPGVAEAVNMGYANFRRAFTEYFGVSPVQYQIRARVEEARGLLRTGRHTVKEVSEILGYADQYTFSKQFKKYAGVNPFDLARGPRPT